MKLPIRGNSAAQKIVSVVTNAVDPVPELQRFLGHAVFINWPKGVKGTNRPWKHFTLGKMTPDYLAALKTGNIGVSLGDASEGLCAVDVDQDALVESFRKANPQLADTFQTHGRRGCVFWFRLLGPCPRSRTLKDSSGNSVGEFRSNGNQSIVWGIHPDTKNPYQWLVKKPVVKIELDSICWPTGIVNPFAPDNSPQQNLPKGDSPNGLITDGSPPLTMLGLRAVGAPAAIPAVSDLLASAIEQAVKIGSQSARRNNEASFQACLALIQIRDVADLSDMSPAERHHFAERWFQDLKSVGRINPSKTKTHYFHDIMNSIKNAKKNMKLKNPVPRAWMLAQTSPLPAEAHQFSGDKTMENLIALCYQLHLLHNGGEWFVSRNDAAKLMGLDETAGRNLSENFHVLVDCGILSIVTPYVKGKRQSTTYRYNEQAK
jgi:hypothetical protein